MSAKEVFEIGGAVLLSLGGAGALLFALSSWLGKVWATRILEQEQAKHAEQLSRLKGELDKMIHVHRVQFEAEFRALKDIWQAASGLRSHISALRPRMSVTESSEGYDECFWKRYQGFQAALNTFQNAIDDNAPFYSDELFREVDALLRIAKHEEVFVHAEKVKDAQWFKDGEESRQQFFQQATVVGATMRKRIEQLAVRAGEASAQ